MYSISGFRKSLRRFQLVSQLEISRTWANTKWHSLSLHMLCIMNNVVVQGSCWRIPWNLRQAKGYGRPGVDHDILEFGYFTFPKKSKPIALASTTSSNLYNCPSQSSSMKIEQEIPRSMAVLIRSRFLVWILRILYLYKEYLVEHSNLLSIAFSWFKHACYTPKLHW